MRRRSIQKPHGVGKVNVTPMIDVVMCLIIFYLIVGKLATDRRMRLPESTSGLPPDRATPMVVEVMPPMDGSVGEPEVALAGKPVDLAALEAAMRDAVEADRGAGEGVLRPVHLRAPGDLPYRLLSPVLNACRRAGLTSVRLVTERSR